MPLDPAAAATPAATSAATSGATREATPAAPWYRDRGRTAGAAVVVALVVLLLAGRLAGGGGPASVLDRAGPVTEALLPVARLGGELAALVVLAGLAACLLTLRRGPGGPGRPVPSALPRSVAGGAVLWALLCAGSALLSASEVSNQPVGDVLRTGLLLDYLRIVPQARTQAVAAGLALAVALLALAGRRRPVGPVALGGMLVLAATALAYPLSTGHSASAANHRLAIAALVVHVLAASAWVAGLAALVVHLREHGGPLRVALGRFQVVALSAFVVVGTSGAVNAWTRLPAAGLLVSTPYGWLLLVKVAALVVLGGFGAWHRRSTLRALAAGDDRAFRRLAAVEVLVMAATVGLAVALSRTPTP